MNAVEFAASNWFSISRSLARSLSVSFTLSILVVVRNPDTRLKFRHNRRTASNQKHHPPLKPPSATISLSQFAQNYKPSEENRPRTQNLPPTNTLLPVPSKPLSPSLDSLSGP